jgi:hypothetical protein
MHGVEGGNGKTARPRPDGRVMEQVKRNAEISQSKAFETGRKMSAMGQQSLQMEFHSNLDLSRNRHTILGCGLKLPSADRGDRLLIQTFPK